jgi:hypothetical protein
MKSKSSFFFSFNTTNKYIKAFVLSAPGLFVMKLVEIFLWIWPWCSMDMWDSGRQHFENALDGVRYSMVAFD